MAGRIVLFGATGYTGRLTAEAMVRRGGRPLLAGRSADRLAALASELGGGLESAVADVARPESVRALVGSGDVLVSTVGPFTRWGDVAVEAAADAGAHYLDSTGEGTFIRRVFERFSTAAQRTGAGLLTAFGYDFVPGNLAGGLALSEAGPAATTVDVGYFATGPMGPGSMSGGTRASSLDIMLDPHYGWRGGRMVDERPAARVRSFEVNGRARPAFSVAATEHYALPRVHPSLRDVGVHLGWFGPATRPLQAVSAGTSMITRIPGSRRALSAALGVLAGGGSSGGPDERQRERTGSHVVAVAADAGGRPLATVHLRGPNPYTFTGEILAWGAEAAAEGALHGAGALGPVDGFGLERLRAGCAEIGLVRV